MSWWMSRMAKEAKLSCSAHALVENRNGLLVDFKMEEADGYAERRNALEMPATWATTRATLSPTADECQPARSEVWSAGLTARQTGQRIVSVAYVRLGKGARR
jgi:hypothetical protein